MHYVDSTWHLNNGNFSPVTIPLDEIFPQASGSIGRSQAIERTGNPYTIVFCKRRATDPSVVVLCGPHLQGAQGVSCARHLTGHGVGVTLFVPNFVKMLEELRQEIDLFDATDGLKLQSYKDLPKSNELIDMVICALDTPNDTITPDQAWYRGILQWLSEVSQAPVLSLDPSNTQTFTSKWGVAVGLPLEYGENIGELYLCSAGLPKKAFEAAGIRYMSPFSHGLFVQLDNS
ncbi:enhancer of mRNA-decapping protein 3-like [Diadema antillarum]|uniref:enhancer of mRNA-decapping protein 3-like n=1 Tax=Diadema antillarum TaxID=105358 RepID=UPI003A8BCA8A